MDKIWDKIEEQGWKQYDELVDLIKNHYAPNDNDLAYEIEEHVNRAMARLFKDLDAKYGNDKKPTPTKIMALSINPSWYGEDVLNHLRSCDWDDAKKWIDKEYETNEYAFTLSEHPYPSTYNELKESSMVYVSEGDELLTWEI